MKIGFTVTIEESAFNKECNTGIKFKILKRLVQFNEIFLSKEGFLNSFYFFDKGFTIVTNIGLADSFRKIKTFKKLRYNLLNFLWPFLFHEDFFPIFEEKINFDFYFFFQNLQK